MKTRGLVSQKQMFLVSLQQKLSDLRDQLGKLLAHPTDDKVEDNRKLDALRKSIQDIQTTIDEETLRVSQLEKDGVADKEQEVQRKKVLKQQQSLIPKLLELSQQMVQRVCDANSLNVEFKKLHDQYLSLARQTGESLLPEKGFAKPSVDWLRDLTHILQREAAGESSTKLRNINITVRLTP